MFLHGSKGRQSGTEPCPAARPWFEGLLSSCFEVIHILDEVYSILQQKLFSEVVHESMRYSIDPASGHTQGGWQSMTPGIGLVSVPEIPEGPARAGQHESDAGVWLHLWRKENCSRQMLVCGTTVFRFFDGGPAPIIPPVRRDDSCGRMTRPHLRIRPWRRSYQPSMPIYKGNILDSHMVGDNASFNRDPARGPKTNRRFRDLETPTYESS